MPAAEVILEGALSVQAALEAGSRPIFELLIAQDKGNDRRLRPLLGLAEAAGIAISRKTRAQLSQLAAGASHGGVLARAGERQYCALPALLPNDRAPFVVMLDGIEDPYNFAGAIRVLYAAGADGVVLRPRNWTSAAALVSRASAGASERMPIAIVPSAHDAADFFRERGLRIAAAAQGRGAKDIFSADLTLPLFLLIGGERRGITRSFLDSADIRLRIPYGRAFSAALGTVGAASIAAFEVLRQRRVREH